jgi:2'-5' RNA ligase
MSVSAFVVEVPAAERLVGELRMRFDASCKLGAPAHITVLFPFMSAAEITPFVVRRAQVALGDVPSFSFSLGGAIGRFMGLPQSPSTLFLSPDPPEPFVALTTALVRSFPMCRPYKGAHDDVVPHLTVAHGDASDVHAAAIELKQRLRTSPLIQTACDTVTLLGNASGRWEEMHVLSLSRA